MKKRPLQLLLLFLMVCFSFNFVAATTRINWGKFEPVLTADHTTPEALASFVRNTYTSDLDKAAALFYWVTHNIAYDTELLKAVTRRNLQRRYTLEEIEKLYEDRISYAWKKRRGVCENYSRLYQRLAALAGLEAEMITGHARGDYLQPGTMGIGHAWNAVKINGRWELLDATWGSGHLTLAMQFEKEFKPQYFLPDHATFAYSHHPEVQEWQLLPEAISDQRYLERPAVGEAFLHYDLTNISHDKYRVDLKKGGSFQISGRGKDLPDQFICANLSTGKQIPCRSVMDGNRFSVSLAKEETGNMKLGILSPAGEIVLAYELRIVR